jgi:hypothetical protein
MGTPGVYLAPDGIGLGDGAFFIDNLGNLNTMGDVSMWGKSSDASSGYKKVVHIDSENGSLNLAGNINMGGNINMTGNMVIGGSITWNASSNPVKVLYAINELRTDNINYESILEQEAEDELSTLNGWHTTYRTGDYYATYSYNGGLTWTIAIQIQGKDGDPGTPGTSATVTTEQIFNMLTNNGATQGIFPFYRENPYNSSNPKTTQLFINAEYIQSGTLSGRKIISEADDKNNVVRITDGYVYLMPNGSTSKPKMRIGFNTESENRDPFIQFGAGSAVSTTIVGKPATDGTALLYKEDTGFSIQLFGSDGKNPSIYFYDYDKNGGVDGIKNTHISFVDSIVDFTYADVRGLNTIATFG